MTRHAALVAELAAEGKRTSGFRRAVLEVLAEYELDGMVDVSHRIPDAYEIDGDVIRAWEVEVTSIFSTQPAKLFDYIDLYDALDYIATPLSFEVWTVDRFGARRQFDLPAAWFSHYVRGRAA